MLATTCRRPRSSAWSPISSPRSRAGSAPVQTNSLPGACCLSRRSRASLRCEFEVAIRDWAVVALQEDRTSWRFVGKIRAACWAGALDVIVNHLPVVEDLYEDSICGLLARRIEARRAEYNVEALPLADLATDF